MQARIPGAASTGGWPPSFWYSFGIGEEGLIDRAGRFLAHSAGPDGRAEGLAEHLRAVAHRAALHAEPFGAAQEARVAGLLHDAGKASLRFVRRLEGKESGLDHWTPGAAVALHRYRQHGIAVALAIQGHHLGLASAAPSALQALFDLRVESHRTLTENDPALLLRRLDDEGVPLPGLTDSLFRQRDPHASALLDLRMLFSALVDADYLETEGHFQRGEEGAPGYRPPAPLLDAPRALELVESRVQALSRKGHGRSSPEVQQMRSDLFRSAWQGGDADPGLFTLTAPTGGGKTLAMLAFALRHAARHGLRRVVLAVPYLSILEQTAREYRKLLEPTFGTGYLLEHHSLAGTRDATPEDDEQGPSPAEVLRRRQAENWDAPLVLTTSVQLLESLFAHRPGPCRKLHRLARSVILFDEVQTLPTSLAVATLATLSHLSQRYGTSVVFSTATQPAFTHLDGSVRDWCADGWKPRELVAPELDLFDRRQRVRTDWRVGGWTPADRLPWDRLADELAQQEQVLCILNLKRHARRLAEMLASRGVGDLFHLSTAMCPAHRQHVLSLVRQRLEDERPCRLVATQCVEAGVDLDFPGVYRAFAPLDALAQAAGRCNRNGRLPGLGRMVVFLPDEPDRSAYPNGDYQRAADVTKELLQSLPREDWDLETPDLFTRWYRRLYEVGRVGQETSEREKALFHAMRSRSFPQVAEHYRLIPEDTVQVVVPWDRQAWSDLRRGSEEQQWIRVEWMRKAQLHAVSVYRSKLARYGASLTAAPLGARTAAQRSDDWFFLEADLYDEEFGLKKEETARSA